MGAPPPAPLLRVPADGLDLFVVPGFLDPATCAGMIARIDAVRRPSTLVDHDGGGDFRTSETGDLDPADPMVAAVERRIAAVVGMPLAHAEPLQGQRYAPGQHFRPHTDAFEPGGADYHRHTGQSGNRAWTAMVYLNAVEEGGETRFGAVDRVFTPRPGMMLIWRNLDPAGQPNGRSLHEGVDVVRGRKYVLTLWFREAPHRAA